MWTRPRCATRTASPPPWPPRISPRAWPQAGSGLLETLDGYAVEFGLHAGDQVVAAAGRSAAAAEVVARLRDTPPDRIAGVPVTSTDLSTVRGRMRTDALIFEGGGQRLVIRPSGTEPKLKCYLEVVEPVATHEHLTEAKQLAARRLSDLREFCEGL